MFSDPMQVIYGQNSNMFSIDCILHMALASEALLGSYPLPQLYGYRLNLPSTPKKEKGCEA